MTTPVRGYDRIYDRAWHLPALPGAQQPVPGEVTRRLPEITWAGLELNFDEPPPGGGADWMTSCVTLVEGWYGTPEMEGQNADRSLGDGQIWGPKRAAARTISIEGAAVGPREQIMTLRDQLAWRTAQRVPAELVISDPWLDTGMSATVRADTDSFGHEFLAGGHAYRWTVTLTAADPLLYDRDWQQLVLTTATAADAGRPYPRLYSRPRDAGLRNGWAYGHPHPPGSAGYLRNRGSADAPVYATYDGDLHEARLTDENTSLLTAPLDHGEQLIIAASSMIAEAPGGASRAQYILPGSRPITVPAFTTSRWHLYSQGSGSVTLSWRSAWW